MKRRCSSQLMLTLAVLLGPVGVASVAAERTIEEFKKYAAKKLPSFSNSQLNALAKLVDKDGSGTISDAEFADRFSALRKVAAGKTAKLPTTKKKTDKPSAGSSGKPVVIEALTRSDKATVLLITAEEIAAAWKPFAEWKTRNGKVSSWKFGTNQRFAASRL